jgi:hypothetical protein
MASARNGAQGRHSTTPYSPMSDVTAGMQM